MRFDGSSIDPQEDLQGRMCQGHANGRTYSCYAWIPRGISLFRRLSNRYRFLTDITYITPGKLEHIHFSGQYESTEKFTSTDCQNSQRRPKNQGEGRERLHGTSGQRERG